MSWYNHSKSQSGVNVVIGGQGRGDAEGGGSHPVTWKPGERLATVITDGQLTSWIEVDGVWQRLSAAPVSVAVPPATLAEWFPSIDVRMDAGTISLDRLTVLEGGDPTPVTPAEVTFADAAGSASDSYTVPATEGVEYLVGDQAVAAGTYPGSGSVTVTARALDGFVLADGATAEWSFTFSAEDGRFPATVSVSAPATGFSWQHLKVKVAVASDGAVAGGLVTVQVGTRSLEVTLDARGKGTLTLPVLSAGLYPVTATFAGTDTVAAATSPTELLRITR